MTEHSGTHIDAFCHQAENLEMYGGVAVDARGADARRLHALGTDTMPPLIARGVLLDCGSARRLALGHASARATSSAPPDGSRSRPAT